MTADTVGGIWDYALELAGGLSRRGIHVTLAVMGREPTPAQRQSALAIPRLDLHHGDFLLEWMAKPEDDLRRAGDWLMDLAERIRAGRDPPQRLRPCRPALEPACAGRGPFLRAVMVAGRPSRAPLPPTGNAYASRVAEGLAAADHVVAPTQAMLDALEVHYGPMPRSRVIWNGRDASVWHGQPDSSAGQAAEHRQRRPYLGRSQEHPRPRQRRRRA